MIRMLAINSTGSGFQVMQLSLNLTDDIAVSHDFELHVACSKGVSCLVVRVYVDSAVALTFHFVRFEICIAN